MKLPSPAMMVALIALIVALSGSAYAVGRTSNDTIDACRNKWSGTLSIKDTCATWEDRVSWNARGPAGPRGAKGERGARGAKGVKGATGAAGSSGGGSGGAQNVIDGNGRVVGTLVGIPIVSPVGETFDVQIGQLIWRVYAADGSLVPTGGDNMSVAYYTDNTCSGAVYLKVGETPVVRPAGIPYAPVVILVGTSFVAYDVPSDLTTKVYTGGGVTGEIYLRSGDFCGGMGFGRDQYGTSALTPITPPTFVPPLTRG